MQRIPREKAIHYVLNKEIPPVVTVEPGEPFIVETEDAFSGRIQSADDLPTSDNLRPFSQYEPKIANPLNGPIFVRGVKKGIFSWSSLKR